MMMMVVATVVLVTVVVVIVIMFIGLTPEQRWERHIICFCTAAKSQDNEKPSSGLQP